MTLSPRLPWVSLSIPTTASGTPTARRCCSRRRSRYRRPVADRPRATLAEIVHALRLVRFPATTSSKTMFRAAPAAGDPRDRIAGSRDADRGGPARSARGSNMFRIICVFTPKRSCDHTLTDPTSKVVGRVPCAAISYIVRNAALRCIASRLGLNSGAMSR